MKRKVCYYLAVIAMFIVSIQQAQSFTSEIKTIRLPDGEETTARLCLPEEGQINTIVVTVHGTGPHTYLVKRQGFNYYDVLADEFCKKGVGFFTYNRRGVDLGETAPWFDKVDSLKHAKYLPYNEAADVETMITGLRTDKRFKNCKIILYGISEGTIIASMVAERGKVKIDALFLHGYAHENMFDIIRWQLLSEKSTNNAMNMINSILDKNRNKAVDREEYESDDPRIERVRGVLFQNASFDSLDVTKDSIYNIQDIIGARKSYHQLIMTKIEKNDGAWIWNNYFRITIEWLKEHFALEPNKTRLLRIDTPIYIFHGENDENVPVEDVYDLEADLKHVTDLI